jgi:hypothetical protein
MIREETIRMRLEQLEHMPEDPIWTDTQRGCIQGKILILRWVLGENRGYEPRCKSLDQR